MLRREEDTFLDRLQGALDADARSSQAIDEVLARSPLVRRLYLVTRRGELLYPKAWQEGEAGVIGPLVAEATQGKLERGSKREVVAGHRVCVALLVGHGGEIIYPKDSTNVHYEAEFTIVIGKTGRRIPESEALSYVLGYTIANDVSARDWQRKEMAEGFLLHGKGFDTFAPIGPVVDTDVDGSDLAIELRLNGEVKQKSRTS